MISTSPKVSIIIPARNAIKTIGQTIESVLNVTKHHNVEIIIVNDGLDKATDQLAFKYTVKVIKGDGRGLASARNIGLKSSSGRIVIFIDADCLALPGWYTSHLELHQRYNGLLVAGGSVSLDPKSSFWARCDHYCSWYNINPYKKAAWVPNQPGLNLSFSRETFDRVGPFKEDLPSSGVHEDIEWEGRLLRLEGRIWFEPQASVLHIDRDDFKGYWNHNYRWGYNSIEIKSKSDVSRFPWIYKKPLLLVAGFIPFAIVFTIYTIICWLKVGKVEPLFLTPFIALGRFAYASGMAIGGFRAIHKRRRERNRVENLGVCDAY